MASTEYSDFTHFTLSFLSIGSCSTNEIYTNWCQLGPSANSAFFIYAHTWILHVYGFMEHSEHSTAHVQSHCYIFHCVSRRAYMYIVNISTQTWLCELFNYGFLCHAWVYDCHTSSGTDWGIVLTFLHQRNSGLDLLKSLKSLLFLCFLHCDDFLLQWFRSCFKLLHCCTVLICFILTESLYKLNVAETEHCILSTTNLPMYLWAITWSQFLNVPELEINDCSLQNTIMSYIILQSWECISPTLRMMMVHAYFWHYQRKQSANIHVPLSLTLLPKQQNTYVTVPQGQSTWTSVCT